jgi:hypothetical protein
MRAQLILLAATALVPLAVSHALEAVAQQPYLGGGGNAGASLATDAKVSGIDARVGGQGQLIQQLTERLENVERCAGENPPKIWNGSQCVSVAGQNGVNGTNGRDGTSPAIPNCTAGQTLAAVNGTLVCQVVSSTTPAIRTVWVSNGRGLGSAVATCGSDEVMISGGCSCHDSMAFRSWAPGPMTGGTYSSPAPGNAWSCECFAYGSGDVGNYSTVARAFATCMKR